MRKPIFGNRWYFGKPPLLQIKILKSIVLSGKLSKKMLTNILGANYPDVSNAVDALLTRKFIRFSDSIRISGRNPEKFYKITEEGLRALLQIKLDAQEFWRVITLLSISSKRPITEREFEEYYHEFEFNCFLHLNIYGYFFLTRFFDNILDQWLQVNIDPNLISIPQKVIECLAFDGPSDIKKIVQKTGTKEENIIEVLSSYSTESNDAFKKSSCYTSVTTRSKINVEKKKEIYYDFIFHTLIVAKETDDAGIIYELSIFGIMLALATISYRFTGIDRSRRVGGIHDNDVTPSLKLFYGHIDQKEYFDIIAGNYKDKMPLVFGKWNFLKSHLGAMLYDSFDFLIYRSSRSYTIDETVWSFGTKEFYDDMQALTSYVVERLHPIYRDAITILRQYKERQEWIANEPRIIAIYKKVGEIGEILKYTDIIDILEELRNGKPLPDRTEKAYTIGDIRYIENVFRDEFSFLFYLSLNTIFLPASYKKTSSASPRLENGKLIITPEAEELFYTLGSPMERLMAILAKDKEIKQWFSRWISGIIQYRSQTSDMMSQFYDKVTKSNQNMKKERLNRNTGIKASIASDYEEYDITQICSDLDSVYDYNP